VAQNKPLGEPQLAYRLPEAGGDLPHRLAHRVEKGVVGVLHQMRAVGNLIGVWQGLCGRLGISTTAVSCDDLDLGLLEQPGIGGRRFPVGEMRSSFLRLKSQMNVPYR
jgi:hypothetical protein